MPCINKEWAGAQLLQSLNGGVRIGYIVGGWCANGGCVVRGGLN
jgi:hypothetical protein